MFLSRLLHLNDIENIVLERRPIEYVLGRIRAGVLEQGTVDLMHEVGLGQRISDEGLVHGGIGIGSNGQLQQIDVNRLTGGRNVTVYGQTEITHDLYNVANHAAYPVIDNVSDIEISHHDSGQPTVSFTQGGKTFSVSGEFIAGCDGFHGVCRQSIPDSHRQEYHLAYPFGWLGILSETPPVSNEVAYISHQRGFALCSMRNQNLSRYYIQVPENARVEDWSDQQFWQEFKLRLPDELADVLVTGDSIEKSIAPLRAFVCSELNYGNLFLAGDSGHIVPPTGAKGLNLAVSDVRYLSDALIQYFANGDRTALNNYSRTALVRVWKVVRFSLWCTRLLHAFPEQTAFDDKIQQADLDYLLSSESAQMSFAENYAGLPY